MYSKGLTAEFTVVHGHQIGEGHYQAFDPDFIFTEVYHIVSESDHTDGFVTLCNEASL